MRSDPPLHRRPDWKPRLHAYLTACATRAFRPGQHDCMLWAAGDIEALTGVDLAAAWRGRYTTLAGGRRILRKAGFTDEFALADAYLPRAPLAYAAPGDLAAIEGDYGLAMGIVQGAQVYGLLPVGWTLLPIAAAQTLWTVR